MSIRRFLWNPAWRALMWGRVLSVVHRHEQAAAQFEGTRDMPMSPLERLRMYESARDALLKIQKPNADVTARLLGVYYNLADFWQQSVDPNSVIPPELPSDPAVRAQFSIEYYQAAQMPTASRNVAMQMINRLKFEKKWVDAMAWGQLLLADFSPRRADLMAAHNILFQLHQRDADEQRDMLVQGLRMTTGTESYTARLYLKAAHHAILAGLSPNSLLSAAAEVFYDMHYHNIRLQPLSNLAVVTELTGPSQPHPVKVARALAALFYADAGNMGKRDATLNLDSDGAVSLSAGYLRLLQYADQYPDYVRFWQQLHDERARVSGKLFLDATQHDMGVDRFWAFQEVLSWGVSTWYDSWERLLHIQCFVGFQTAIVRPFLQDLQAVWGVLLMAAERQGQWSSDWPAPDAASDVPPRSRSLRFNLSSDQLPSRDAQNLVDLAVDLKVPVDLLTEALLNPDANSELIKRLRGYFLGEAQFNLWRQALAPLKLNELSIQVDGELSLTGGRTRHLNVVR